MVLMGKDGLHPVIVVVAIAQFFFQQWTPVVLKITDSIDLCIIDTVVSFQIYVYTTECPKCYCAEMRQMLTF